MTRFQTVPQRFFGRFVIAGVALVLLQTGCGKKDDNPATVSSADEASQAAVMQKGLDLLYKGNDPMSAADTFRSVLKMNAQHYGARYQLAKALDLSGKPTEARPIWTSVLETAKSINDTATASFVAARLAQQDTVSQVAMMNMGLDKLYRKNDAAGAVADFKSLLAKNPEHYGANFQLAKALDAAGKPDEARTYWQKSLSMAQAIKDSQTIATARARLQGTK
jgi:Tfp pilus assembly protein PilF